MDQNALLISLLLGVGGCVTVTARPDGGTLDESEPAVSESQWTLGGLGTHHYDVRAACHGKPADQIQWEGFGDFAEARVWCKP